MKTKDFYGSATIIFIHYSSLLEKLTTAHNVEEVSPRTHQTFRSSGPPVRPELRRKTDGRFEHSQPKACPRSRSGIHSGNQNHSTTELLPTLNARLTLNEPTRRADMESAQIRPTEQEPIRREARVGPGSTCENQAPR